MYKTILVFTATMFILSCEKAIPLDQDEVEPRIAVNGLFSAGDTIIIHLSESRDILYDGSLPALTGATAKLYDVNNNLIGDFIHQADGYYQLSNYLPVAGATYRLEISNPGFKSVSAQSSAPSILSINSMDTLRKGVNMQYSIAFNDNGAEKNFYAITVKKVVSHLDPWGTGEPYTFENPYFYTTEAFVQNNSPDVDGKIWGSIMLFSDATFNGGTCTFTAEHDLFGEGSFPDDSIFVVVGLHSLSEDYFKYSTSLDKYQESEGDPFAQPVQVYSNIEDGFGIFGGYSGHTDTLIIQ